MNMTPYTSIYLCPPPFGALRMESDGESLTALRFIDLPPNAPGKAGNAGEPPVFAETKRWLDLYFSGKIPGFTPPIALDTTPFCREVCALLSEIPYGQTTTYGVLAKKLAASRGIARMSAQAVGGAVGRNPIALILPCHRVIGAKGALVGYAAGIFRKEALLKLEKEANKTP